MQEIVVPGYTHLQQAQPHISMGQFGWLTQAFLRDAKRLFEAYDAVDECPLGSGVSRISTLPLWIENSPAVTWVSRMTAAIKDSVACTGHHFSRIFSLRRRLRRHVNRLCGLTIYFYGIPDWVKLPDAFCANKASCHRRKIQMYWKFSASKARQMNSALMDFADHDERTSDIQQGFTGP